MVSLVWCNPFHCLMSSFFFQSIASHFLSAEVHQDTSVSEAVHFLFFFFFLFSFVSGSHVYSDIRYVQGVMS